MLKRTFVSTAALAGFVFLAFGSAGGGSSDFDFDKEFGDLDVGGGGGENVAACKRYVEKVNGLACMSSVQMNADDICPDALDISTLDMSGYYDCMADNSKCNGDIPDLGGISSCEMPSM
jgi:hypothetical protein